MSTQTDKTRLLALKLIQDDPTFRKEVSSLIGRINAQKRRVSKERASEIGRANANKRWEKQRGNAED